MRDVKLISNSLSRSIDYEKKGNRNQFKQEWNHLDMKFRIILKEMFRQKYLIEKALIPLIQKSILRSFDSQIVSYFNSRIEGSICPSSTCYAF